MSTIEEGRRLLFEEGEKQRRKVLGDAHVDKSSGNVSDFARAGQELVTQNAWGTLWSRPGLAHRDRSLIVVPMLCALGKQTELAAHIKGALNNGLTEDELKEVLMQVMVVCGAPAGMEAFRTADAAIKAWKEEHSAGK